MPTLRDAIDRIATGYRAGWFSPDTRADIGVILGFFDTDIPTMSVVPYALEPGKFYVMAYDAHAVSSSMLAAMRKGLKEAGIHIFVVGTRGNPKDAIAFAPTKQASQAQMVLTPKEAP